MKRPVAIGLSPNLESCDAQMALSFLLRPWGYTKGSASRDLEKWFEKQYALTTAVSFTSARGALYAVLKNLSLQKGDEVLVQAFTCKAVIEPLLALGLIPVYVDIQNNFILSEKDVLKKITKRTKALILQHTFGIPNIPVSLLKKIKQKGIFIVEDMAHIVNTKTFDKRIGGIGEAAIFSFGRDKAISSVSGGIVTTKDKRLGEKLRLFQQDQKFPSYLWIFQNLFHSVIFYFLILPLYDVLKLGKIFLVIFQKIHLLSMPVEEKGEYHFDRYYQKFPPVMASLVLLQLSRVEMFNKKRKESVIFYNKLVSQVYQFAGPLLRYPFFSENPTDMKAFFKKYHIYLGDWYAHIIDPKSTNLSDIGYTMGMCPVAENIACHIINLPTYPTLTETDKEKIAMILKEYAKGKRNKE